MLLFVPYIFSLRSRMERGMMRNERETRRISRKKIFVSNVLLCRTGAYVLPSKTTRFGAVWHCTELINLERGWHITALIYID